MTTYTNARWLKTVLDKAGIDTNIFHAHSTRAASTSAKTAKLSVNTIMTAAGWTNALILSEFCDKPVILESTENLENFGHNLLQSWYPLHGGRFDIGQFQLLILHWAISVVNKSSLLTKNWYSFMLMAIAFKSHVAS